MMANYLLSAALLLCTVVASVYGQSVDRNLILLHNDVIHVRAQPHLQSQRNEPQTSAWLDQFSDNTKHQLLVAVKGPITPSSKSLIERATGHNFVLYIPHDSFLVYATLQEAERIRATEGVVWVGLYQPHHKLPPQLLHQAQSHKEQHQLQQQQQTQSRSVTEKSFDVWVLLAPTTSQQHISSQEAHDHMFECHHDVSALVQKWTTQLAGMGVPSGAFSIVDLSLNSKIQVSIWSPVDVDTILTFLSEQPEVHFVERVPEIVTMNHFSAAVTQSGDDVVRVDGSSTPFWGAGLTGEGQIIGVGDTGLDINNCYFYDAATPVAPNTPNPKHRKVLAYYFTAGKGDFGDAKGGHGTHVCGSIAGDALEHNTNNSNNSTSMLYNGMAFKSKLVMVDLMTEASSGGSHLSVPMDLGKNYFMLAYSLGARLFSSSWGSSGTSYSSQSAVVDNFSWNHKDFLSVFAAGNDGDKGLYSVSTPSVAKNCLSVAAHQNSPQSWKHYAMYQNIDIVTPNQTRVTALQSGFTPRLRTTLSATLVAAVPEDACTPLSGDVSGKIVLINRGKCLFVDKVKAARSAGALGVLIANNEPGEPILMGGEQSNATNLIAGMISRSDGDLLRAYLNQVVLLTVPINATVLSYQNENTLADFSSIGPTSDGRFKPDLAGPGDIIFSANSHGYNATATSTCGDDDIIPMKGTSMATPTISGLAALVRQYYMDGFHPSGTKSEKDSFTPSGALVKATLIHSTVPLTTAVDSHGNVKQLTSIPSVQQGYGRVQLSSALRLSSSSSLPRQYLMHVDDNSTLQTSDSHTYCFAVTVPSAGEQKIPLKVTLVWTDAPGSVSSHVALVNDLDLVVTSSYGEIFLGNSLQVSDSVNGEHPIADTLNNVEQVTIFPSGSGGNLVHYTVRIVGSNVPVGPQPFALIASGNMVYHADGNMCQYTCPNGCLNHGTCNNGVCKCSAGFTGVSCELSPKPLTQQVAVSGNVSTYGWAYYTFEVPQDNTLNLLVQVTASAGDPDFFVRLNEFPTLRTFDEGNTECDSCGSKVTGKIGIPQATGGGVYYIGVYGQCCSTAQFSISVELTSQCVVDCKSADPGSNAAAAVVIVLIVLGLIAAGIVVFFLYRRRKQQQERALYAHELLRQDDEEDLEEM